MRWFCSCLHVRCRPTSAAPCTDPDGLGWTHLWYGMGFSDYTILTSYITCIRVSNLSFTALKGIVHPKNENYPIIYSASSHPRRCIWLSSLWRIQSALYKNMFKAHASINPPILKSAPHSSRGLIKPLLREILHSIRHPMEHHSLVNAHTTVIGN